MFYKINYNVSRRGTLMGLHNEEAIRIDEDYYDMEGDDCPGGNQAYYI